MSEIQLPLMLHFRLFVPYVHRGDDSFSWEELLPGGKKSQGVLFSRKKGGKCVI